MVHEIQVLLFGDQSEDIIGELRSLVVLKGNPLLSHFFDKAYITLRDEVAQNPQERQNVPSFTSIETLLSKYVEAGVTNPALESAFVYIYQIATLLRHAGYGVEAYPKPETTRIVGSCTGLLAAASVSCAHTYLQLVSVSVEVLKVAFRIGLQVKKICDAIEENPSGPASWSAIFPGVGKDAALKAVKEFYSNRAVAPTSWSYVSATSKNSTTISGYPGELDSLIESGIFKSSRPIRLPIYGPYHAPHFFSSEIVASLLDTVSETTSTSWTPRIPIVANGRDDVYASTTFHHLMEEVMEDILRKALDWDSVCQACVASVNEAEPEQCRIVPIGAKKATSSLQNAFANRKSDSKIFVDDHKSSNAQQPQPTGPLGKSKIAIVGMAGRYPEAESLSEFWDLLKKGLDVHREVPPDRFDAQAHYDPTGKRKNTSHTPYGCFVKHPGLFDPKFFNMSPKEALQTDPMHRLALSTAYEALEMSGYVPNRTPSTALDRVGTFYGQTSDDWREIQDAQHVQTYFIPGSVRAFAPGRINYHFGFSGPSFSVDTACSSSLAAINIACNSLWQGDCDTALAGGLNVLTNPDIFAGLSRGQFLSKTGNCKTFDDGADGYCRGDGAGTVILKRLEDAEADNDPILAVILGTGTNHSAEAVSITHPHAGAQEFLFKKVLAESGMDADDISYVEMHGTGTQAGDAIEMESVLNSFAPGHRQRPADRPLYLGSVKANVGHGEAASGITALTKVLLMLENNAIPPHCGIKTKMNHNFPDLAARNVHISLGRETPWNRPEGGKRRFFLNNFSAAGGNTSLLMEDGPLKITDGKEDPRPNAIVAVSGKTKPAFIQNTKNLVEFLVQNPTVDLPSLSYTTTARRSHYQYRTITSGSSVSEIEASLRKSLEGNPTSISSSKPSIAFTFTGQGSHYSAMGKVLYDTIPQFRSDIQRFDLLAQNQGFPSIIPLIDGTTPIESLSPVVVQTGAVCLQIALVRLWESFGITPSVVVGHSLGEYAALYAAGVLSVNDAIFLTATRATILEKNCTMHTHSMLAVSATTEQLEGVIDGVNYELACVNGPKATVISGEAEKIDELKSNLSSQGLKSTKLDVPFAFHSSQVDPALDELEAATSHITYNTPKLPIISPLSSSVIEDDGPINSQYLSRHTRLTVNFLGGLQAAKETEVIKDNTVFIEIGSHPICTGMVKSTLGSATIAVPSLRKDEDAWKTLASSLCGLHSAGVVINWNSYHQSFPACHNTLRLPTYEWEATNYWIDYVNNWTLTKGESPTKLPSVQEERNSLSTSAVQRIVEEKFHDQAGTITTETDISHPDLEETIKGHIVNGSALCSSAVYADMALTIGDYVHRKLKPKQKDFAMDCSNMVVEKPLIAAGGTKPQLLRTTTDVDLSRGSCIITIYSVNEKGQKTVEHAHCQVKYGDASKRAVKFSRQKYLIQSQLDRLLKGSEEGQLSKLSRKMAYKLFSVLVDYQDAYKGMAEVILDSANREGTARVDLKASPDGTFFMAPYQIDSLCHLAGFIMNANDELDSSETVFVNHGWESLEFSEKPVPGEAYRSYVRMQPTGPNSKDYSGDVYVFNKDGDIIGEIGGLEFQYLPRKVLNRVLPAAGGAKSSAPTPAPTAKATEAPKKTASKSAPKKTSKSQSAPAASNAFSRALDIMADEIGVSASEISDDSELSALGVDSLMSLAISGRFNEELQVEVPSPLLADCQTIKEVRKVFEELSGESSSVNPKESDDSSSDEADDSGFSTPGSTGTESTDCLSEVDEIPASKEGDMIALIREVIAEETGLEASEITSSMDLASVGIDSLMSLQILGTIREQTGSELSPTLFSDHETFGDVEKALGGGKKEEEPPATPPSKPTEEVRTESKEKANQSTQNSEASYKASSILLQGNPKTATKTLFLFPDGSGSPTSYANIPSIAPKDVALYALGCPFMKDAEAFDCGIEGVTSLYLKEIRRRQPKGPYVLGGWSAGGICAYEASLQLQAAGEVVEKLVFLDVPCPLPAQALPARLHHFFDSIGLLGAEGEAPDWLLPHFTATIRALSSYRPKIMDAAKDTIPKTYTIMARDGVCKNDSDPRPELTPDDPPHMNWLLFNRTDFGPIGWDALLGGTENIVGLEPISNVNHFTMMMNGPHVGEISNRIRTALEVSD